MKRRRLQHLLLLALRCALLLLLVLAFANPFVERSPAASGSGKRLHVLAIDQSFSMRAGDALGAAKREALATLAALPANDAVQVVSFSSRLALRSQPSANRAELQAAIQATAPADGRSSYGELTRGLRALAEASRLPVTAHIFSDMQKTSLPVPFSELRATGGATVQLHPVSSKATPNWFVETVIAPQSIFQPKKVRVQATVAGSSTPATELAVSLVLNERAMATKKVPLLENWRASVEFTFDEAPYGWNRGEVRLESKDSLPADDRMRFATERKEARNILFLHELSKPRGLAYYRAAIDSTPDAGFSVSGSSVDAAANMDLSRYALVVLSDVGTFSQAVEDKLTRYVRTGGSILVALGASSASRQKVPVTGTAIGQSQYAARQGDRFHTAGSVDMTHPALGRAGSFANVKFYRTVLLSPGPARVLARLNDQSPLLLEQRLGEGKVLIFASTLDNLANDLPLSPSFVPFIEQSAQYLAGVEPAPSNYAVDSFLELRADRTSGTSLEVLDPDGKRTLSLAEAAKARSLRLAREGFYEVRRPNGRGELAAVYADRRESDLDPIPAETLTLWQNAAKGIGQAPGEAAPAPKPVQFGLGLALVALLLVIAESVLSSRYLTQQQPWSAERKKAA